MVHMAKPGQAGPSRPRRVPGGSQGTQRPSGPPCHPPQGQGLGGATPTHPPPSTASLICFCIKSANGGRRRRHGLGKERASALPRLGSIAGGGGWRWGERGAEWGDPRVHPVPAGSAAGRLPHAPPEALPQFPHPSVTRPWSCCRAGRKGLPGPLPWSPWAGDPPEAQRGHSRGSRARQPPGLSDWRCRTVGSCGSERQTVPMWPPVGMHRACALRVYPLQLTSWGRVASDPEGPPGPSRGSEGTPSPGPALGKPSTTLLGTTFQVGKLERGALPRSLGGAWVLTALLQGDTSPSPISQGCRDPTPSRAPSPPHGDGGTAVPGSCRGDSEDPPPGAWQG